MESRPLIVIAGPTGSGKSALALWLATRLRAEIVNCDSLQVYRYFDIGTAKIPPGDRGNIPHHLIDILNPDETFSAGDYARISRDILQQTTSRGNIPIVVGGTGFYLRAMLDGLFVGPQRDDALRARLTAREQRAKGSLHRILGRLDAAAAARIHSNDINKLIRALEICLLARTPVTELYGTATPALEGFQPLLIGLDPPRADLYQVLNQRVEQMFENGLYDEVRRILAMGYSPLCKPFESLGYRQCLLLFQGNYTLKQAIEETQTETRRYAKRQWTWFKKDTRVSWIPGFGHSPQTQQNTLETLVSRSPKLTNFFL